MLLLGPSHGGKSTIMKQTKILYGEGFAADELALYRSAIRNNIIDSIRTLIEAIRRFNVDMDSDQNVEYCDYLMDVMEGFDPAAPSDQRVADAIEAVWNDSCIEKVMDHCKEFYPIECAPYFLKEIRRIASPSYIPTDMDVLRAKTRTAGISRTRFECRGVNINMYDISGQQGERRKWIHHLDNVTFVVFPVALSEYDQSNLEESSQNRMMESLEVFDSVVNSRWFRRSIIALIFTKTDLFRAKITTSPIRDHFPDYEGGDDFNQAVQYFARKFEERNREIREMHS